MCPVDDVGESAMASTPRLPLGPVDSWTPLIEPTGVVPQRFDDMKPEFVTAVCTCNLRLMQEHNLRRWSPKGLNRVCIVATMKASG